MGQLRNQISWLLKGGSRTTDALNRYADDLRALQQKVARIDEELQSLRQASNDRLGQLGTQLEYVESEIDSLKGHLRVVVDDLGDRVGHLSEHLKESASTTET